MWTFRGINSQWNFPKSIYNENQIISLKISTKSDLLLCPLLDDGKKREWQETQQIPIYPLLHFFFVLHTRRYMWYLHITKLRMQLVSLVCSKIETIDDANKGEKIKMNGKKNQQQQRQRCAERAVVWINDTPNVNRSCKFMQAERRGSNNSKKKNPNKTESIDFYFPVNNLQWLRTEHWRCDVFMISQKILLCSNSIHMQFNVNTWSIGIICSVLWIFSISTMPPMADQISRPFDFQAYQMKKKTFKKGW